MALVPPEIKDPSPYLYNNALYTLAGLSGLAFVVATRIKPVDPKHYE